MVKVGRKPFFDVRDLQGYLIPLLQKKAVNEENT